MALVELSDKCLTENDPNIELYDELFRALQTIENNTKNDNMVFWFFQYQVLSKLGLNPIFLKQILIINPLPNPYKSANSKMVFECFEKNESYLEKNLRLTSKRTDMQYPTT